MCLDHGFVVDINSYLGLAHEWIPEPVRVPHLSETERLRSQAMLNVKPFQLNFAILRKEKDQNTRGEDNPKAKKGEHLR